MLTTVETNSMSKMSDIRQRKRREIAAWFFVVVFVFSQGVVRHLMWFQLGKNYGIMSVYLFFWTFPSQTDFLLNCFNGLCNTTEDSERNLLLDLLCVNFIH